MSAAPGSATRALRAWIILPDAVEGSASVRVWSLSSLDRLERALLRSGVGQVERLAANDPLPAAPHSRCSLFRSDYFYDERLIAGLLATDDVLLVGEQGQSIAANVAPADFEGATVALREETGPTCSSLRRAVASDLAPAYNAALRKFDPPFLYRSSAADAREIENRIFASSYKGITDLVTKWVFPIPARSLVRQLAKLGVRPNTVTAVSYVLTALAAWLFYVGAFGSGLVCAWLMTFLDTVDGKLARVTLTSSAIGNVADHGLDLIHPPFWWAAWAYGLAPGAAGYELAMWIVVVGYVTGRLLEGIFLLIFRMEIFTWRPFDAFFRTIIARRNPNLLMLSAGVLAGRPGLGFLAVAVWTVACHVVPIIRIVQALIERSRGGTIRPWHEERSEASPFVCTAALCALIVFTVGIASPTRAIGPAPQLDPRARLPRGDDASEYWDLTAQLDSGHRVFARFMITNVGPGERNAIAVGHVVGTDGRVHAFRNGRRSASWKLSEDRLHLDVGSSELDLHGPTYRLDIHKDDVQIDLHFAPGGSPQPPAELFPPGYWLDVLDVAAPLSGSLKLPGMTEPLAVRGHVALVHTWLDRSEADLSQRRIEFFSLQSNRIYVLEITRPDGNSIRWIRAENNTGGLAVLSSVPLQASGELPDVNDEYWTPRVLLLGAEGVKGRIRLDRSILSHDSLAEIPQPFRFFVARQMQPWRVWAESSFDVTLRADPDRSPSQLIGSGITVVTFSSPTGKP